MKKTYTAPDVNIIEYKVEDVLLASGGVGMLGLLNKEEEMRNRMQSMSPLWTNVRMLSPVKT